MSTEEQIKIINNLIQCAKDYARSEGSTADNDEEVIDAERLIVYLQSIK